MDENKFTKNLNANTGNKYVPLQACKVMFAAVMRSVTAIIRWSSWKGTKRRRQQRQGMFTQPITGKKKKVTQAKGLTVLPTGAEARICKRVSKIAKSDY